MTRQRLKPYFTWTYVLVATLCFFLFPLWESSLYGQETEHVFLGFAPYSTGQEFWGSVLFSPFVHQGLSHFLVNILFFMLLSSLIEWRFGARTCWLLLLVVHVIVLAFAMLNDFWISPSKRVYFGSSHFVFAFAAFWGVSQRIWLFLWLPVSYLIYVFISSEISINMGSNLTHLLAFLSGALIATVKAKDLSRAH